MILVKKDKHLYKPYFDDYPVFKLFIDYTYKYKDFDLYINDLTDIKSMIMHIEPAYLFWGSVLFEESESIKQILHVGAWIISPNMSWDYYLAEIYGTRLKKYPRVLFDDSKLSIDYLRTLHKMLPRELSIVPIENKHLQKGMIKDQIIDKFFTECDFVSHGFGFALVNQNDVVHGFALTNYPVNQQKEIEVSYRVGYDDYPYYRKKGIGTTLVCTFIEESLLRGYKPIWDAATDVSAHIARNLGYHDFYHWNMYHLIE